MNILQKYFKYRQGLIDQYVKGDMSKAEYLQRNLEAVQAMNISPFKNIDSVEKGLFNYQYYNAMAKRARADVRYDKPEYREGNIELANYYYSKKDAATSSVLKLMDYKGVYAYYVHANSKFLDGRLFEIVVEDYEMILHSASEVILNQLREYGVFEDSVKKSVIDRYINQKY